MIGTLTRNDTITPELVAAASLEAGDRSMQAGGRDRWNWQDWVAANKAVADLSPHALDD